MEEEEKGFRRRFAHLFPEAGPEAAGPEAAGPEAAYPEGLLGALAFRRLERGESILREGEACRSLPFVVEGAIRVFKRAESGREITLYRVEAGECCILSSACAAGLLPFPAAARAASETLAAFLPFRELRGLLGASEAFRDFLLGQYASRLAGVFALVEEVAFSRVDERLREWLEARRRAGPSSRVLATHQEIADHLGSSREVVSRILGDWEERGALELARGEIRLLPGFEALAP